jgi:hypothetical protein
VVERYPPRDVWPESSEGMGVGGLYCGPTGIAYVSNKSVYISCRNQRMKTKTNPSFLELFMNLSKTKPDLHIASKSSLD